LTRFSDFEPGELIYFGEREIGKQREQKGKWRKGRAEKEIQGESTIKDINADPKNNALRTFWIFSCEYESRSQAVPIRIARPKYIAIRTP